MLLGPPPQLPSLESSFTRDDRLLSTMSEGLLQNTRGSSLAAPSELRESVLKQAAALLRITERDSELFGEIDALKNEVPATPELLQAIATETRKALDTLPPRQSDVLMFLGLLSLTEQRTTNTPATDAAWGRIYAEDWLGQEVLLWRPHDNDLIASVKPRYAVNPTESVRRLPLSPLHSDKVIVGEIVEISLEGEGSLTLQEGVLRHYHLDGFQEGERRKPKRVEQFKKLVVRELLSHDRYDADGKQLTQAGHWPGLLMYTGDLSVNTFPPDKARKPFGAQSNPTP